MRKDFEPIKNRVEPADMVELPHYPFREDSPSPYIAFTTTEVVDELFGMKALVYEILQIARMPYGKDAHMTAGEINHFIAKIRAKEWGRYNPDLSSAFQDDSFIKQVLDIFLTRVALVANQQLGEQWTITPLFNGNICEFFIKKIE